MSEHIRKSHNVTLLLYHIVCPVKYRKKVFTDEVEKTLKDIIEEISVMYEINFIEIGTDEDHVHFLLQSIPSLSVSRIVTIIKSITAREIFKKHPEVKKMLWKTSFWTSGYYANTVSKFGNKESLVQYIKSQGKEYKSIISNQIGLFD